VAAQPVEFFLLRNSLSNLRGVLVVPHPGRIALLPQITSRKSL
jgi:hypothetical protein